MSLPSSEHHTPTLVAPAASDVVVLGKLSPSLSAPLEEETPLFSADSSFAYQEGGKWTQAFLDGLPAAWQTEHLIVDSLLVWLQRDQSLPSRWYHHEVFPWAQNRGYGLANAERDVEHIVCAFGAPSVREFLLGTPSPSNALLPFDLYQTPEKDFAQRHAWLRAQREAGQLRTLEIGLGVMHRFDGRTFQRAVATAVPGFHFYIRATRGSGRPIVNGRCNVIARTSTGPWTASFIP